MSQDGKSASSLQTFLARGLEGRIAEALRDTPVVCLLGPRQSGKSTLVSRMAPTRQMVSLDDAAYLKLADPRLEVGQHGDFPTRVGMARRFGLCWWGRS